MIGNGVFWRAIWLSLLPLASGCSEHETFTRTIAGHTFKIPREYLVDATVFYLPESQSNPLRFVINPHSPLPEQHMVSIQVDAPCPTENKNSQCRVYAVPLIVMEKNGIRKTYSAVDRTSWEYQLGNRGKVVAFCYDFTAGDGLCTLYGLYKDLPYSVGLRDSAMSDSIELRKTVERKLADWETSG